MAIMRVEIPEDATYLFEWYDVVPYDIFMEKMDEYYKIYNNLCLS